MKSTIIIIGGVVAAIGAIVASMGPELRRYMKLRSM
jgi:hypothetical protein